MTFDYCPHCGTALTKKEIGDEGLVPFCEKCARPFFPFSYPCVICLVTDGCGSYALIRQSYGSGRHVCVAGYVKTGESFEETAAREISEEIGLRVKKLDYLGSWHHQRGDNIMAGFAATVERGAFTLSDEVAQANWYNAETALELLSQSTIAKKLLICWLQKGRNQ